MLHKLPQTHNETLDFFITVTECEKKWRYLRDKYVKERRRLIEETKTTGRESKSNWQHYEPMEFLATHLRLPSNSRDGGGSRADSMNTMDDDDGQRYSDGSPNGLLSPPSSLLADMPGIKSEHAWANQDTTDQFKPLFAPPQYPMVRALGPSFTQNPLWAAMWSSSLAQAQVQQQQAAAAAAVAAQQLSSSAGSATASQREAADSENPSTTAATAGSEVNVCDDLPPAESGEMSAEPPVKKLKTPQEVSINVSIKDILLPAEKYSEYHFCVSLAQMMENVPPENRADLKIKLIQMITSSYTPNSTNQIQVKSMMNGNFAPT